MRYNTSSNMASSSKKIYTDSNNNSKIEEFPVGNDIFFGKEKEKVRGKIINIPKKINNKKENRSQSKKKKLLLFGKRSPKRKELLLNFHQI